MNKINKIINEYENYLIKLKGNIDKIYSDIKIKEDIKTYESFAKSRLYELEELSKDYKLYDSNYEEFMIAMGKLAVGLKKLDKLGVDVKYKEEFLEMFFDLHTKFEDLQCRNIMKDAYVWK